MKTGDLTSVIIEQDWKAVLDEANQIGVMLLSLFDRDYSAPLPDQKKRQYASEWLGWLSRAGKVMSVKDQFLDYLADTHSSEFTHVLKACRDNKSNLDIRALLQFLPPEMSSQLARKIEIERKPTHSLALFNREIGSDITAYLLSRYGTSLPCEDSLDVADLLHAANFGKFDDVKDTHYIIRELASYLSSSHKPGAGSVYLPSAPSLDAIISFFNAYDSKKAIEDILTNVEKRKSFRLLNEDTKPWLHNALEYHRRQNDCIDQLLLKLNTEYSAAQLDGSKRILSRLLSHYQRLRDTSLDGIPKEVNGSAFPRFYQLETALDIVDNKRMLIGDEMGTGKTAIPILASYYLGLKKPGFKTLVVTTYSNKTSFASKIRQYLPDVKVMVLNGTSRHKEYDTAQSSDFVVVNYETLRARDWKRKEYSEWEVDDDTVKKYEAQLHSNYRSVSGINSFHDYVFSKLPAWIRQTKRNAGLDDLILSYAKLQDLDHYRSAAKRLEGMKFDHLIVDEVQNAKSDTSKNAQAVNKVAASTEYVTCLSGTPFVNGLSDLNTLLGILGVYDKMVTDTETRISKLTKEGNDIQANLEQRNLVELRRYIESGDIQQIILANPRMIRDYLRPIMTRRRITEVLDMPELAYHEEFIRLPINQRCGYFVLENHDFENASDQLRALQMYTLSPNLYFSRFHVGMLSNGDSSGLMPAIPGDIVMGISAEGDMKYERLKEIINSSGNKTRKNILVFSSHFREGVTRDLESRLKLDFQNYTVLRVDGTVIGDAREDILYTFNNQDNVIIVATLKTLNEGIELQKKCSTVVSLDLPFTWAAFAQGIARTWRAYQDEKVDVYTLFISNSLDEGKWRLIQNKRRLGDLLLDGAPLNAQELAILDMRDESIAASGFFETYVQRQRDDLMKLMGSLNGRGRATIEQILGSINRESETYADGYVLNTLSDRSLHHILCSIRKYSGMGKDEIGLLDGKILDLAAGYGKFSHATGIATENLEINPIMIERARPFAPKAHYIQGVMQDVHTIYGNDRFKHVIFSLSYHYASDEEKGKLIYDIHQTLEDGGYLHLTEPESAIDEAGRKTLAKSLRYTGYTIVEASMVKEDEKSFYSITARKDRQGALYTNPIKLRGEPTEDPDEIKSELDITKKRYAAHGTN